MNWFSKVLYQEVDPQACLVTASKAHLFSSRYEIVILVSLLLLLTAGYHTPSPDLTIITIPALTIYQVLFQYSTDYVLIIILWDYSQLDSLPLNPLPTQSY